jgi:hypothetical protein
MTPISADVAATNVGSPVSVMSTSTISAIALLQPSRLVARWSKGGQTAEWSPIVGYQIMRFGSPDLEMARAIHALAWAPSAIRSAVQGALCFSPPAAM